MTENERKSTMILLADTIREEIRKMCVTQNLSEFDTMHAHAKQNLDKLTR